ncbi:mesoderm induction early response protein 1-like [Patiria miniata]|uniref:Mesoderm induction early response protein 1 n=1 Tax=Patiria miniata TaxID=46514 RepID=A0A913Z9P7_PATMI|nr:mesoderm induction early response protein 1-like [Patiria miniata]
MAEPATSDSSPETDQDFDVTAEMLVHDIDDEQTIDEEEGNEIGECFSNELDDLAEEAAIPVDQLWRMYANPPPPMASASTPPIHQQEDSTETDGSTDEILNSRNLTLDKEEIAQDLLPNQGENVEEGTGEESIDDLHSDLFPGPGSHASDSPGSYGTHRLLRSNTATDGDSDSGSEDSDYVPPEDWKKTISVGSDFQAVIPEGLSHYGDAPAYDNEDRLLWDPNQLCVEPVESYLREVQRPPPGTMSVKSLPLGSHVRDDERSLYILLQCGHNVDEALRRHRMQIAPPMDEMSLWSEEECRNFESGLRAYGKNFHLIQQNKVRTRSVGELVQFYYLWKKTARHDSFANQARLTKKKYHLHPGITDYMDRFLDDAESLVSPIPSHSLLDKHRINNKLSHSASMLSTLNGASPAELLSNGSPEVGGLVMGDLPNEMSATATATASQSLKHPADFPDSNGPAKHRKLEPELDHHHQQVMRNLGIVIEPDRQERDSVFMRDHLVQVVTTHADPRPPPSAPHPPSQVPPLSPAVKPIRGNITLVPPEHSVASDSVINVRPLVTSNMQATNPVAQ